MACINILPIFIIESLVYTFWWNQKCLIQKILVLQNMFCTFTFCLLCKHEENEAEDVIFQFFSLQVKKGGRAEGGWFEINRLKKIQPSSEGHSYSQENFLCPFSGCFYVDFHFGQVLPETQLLGAGVENNFIEQNHGSIVAGGTLFLDKSLKFELLQVSPGGVWIGNIHPMAQRGLWW